MKKGINIFYLLIFIISYSCSKDNSDQKNIIESPAIVILIFPENNTECNEGTIISDTQSEVSFRWNKSPNADSYTLVINNIDSGTTQNINTNDTEEKVILERGTNYSWQVISKLNSTSLTTFSSTWRFFNASIPVESHVPDQAVIVSPVADSIVNSCPVILEWTSSDKDNDIKLHDVILDLDYPPTKIIGSTTENNFQPNLLSDKTYYWQVITIDNDGNKSSSEISSFKIDPSVESSSCSPGVSSSTIKDLVKDGSMDNKGDWKYRQLWTQSDNEVNHGFVDGEYAFRSVDGVRYSNAILWQEINVESGVVYSFKMNVRSGGTSNSWLEVYFGSQDVNNGSDEYTDGGVQIFVKSFGDNENCGVNSYDGSIFDVAKNGCPIPSESLLNQDGKVVFSTSDLTANGTIILGIKAGNYDGTFGSGIFIDDISLIAD